MAVYFFTREGDDSLIKIGYAKTIDTRVGAQTASYGTIRLVGWMPGDRAVEGLLHFRFHQDRREGEWFVFSEQIRDFVANQCTPSSKIFRPRGASYKKLHSGDALSADRAAAKRLMDACLSKYPTTLTLSTAMEATFQSLAEVNPAWTRRRIVSIHHASGRRIDLFEVVDMLKVLGVPTTEWGDWLRPAGNVIPISSAHSSSLGALSKQADHMGQVHHDRGV
jgi:hypothetical protein